MPRRTFASSRGFDPPVVEFDDGRSYTFPPDVPADGMLAWIEQWGKVAEKAEDLPMQATLDFYQMLMGEDLHKVRHVLSWYELSSVVTWLIECYTGGDEAGPPGQGGSVSPISSPAGETSKSTSGESTDSGTPASEATVSP